MHKIISLISIKGGTGKTTNVVNIAYFLSKAYKKKVLVVDANFSAPNLRINLGLSEPKIGIHEMIQENTNPAEAIYKTSYGFNILPAKLNNKKLTKVSSLKEYLWQIKRDYDFIIIDSSPNTNAEIISAIDSSDSVIIVMNPEYSSLSCALMASKIAGEKEVDICGILLNKVYGSKNELSEKDIEKTTGMKIIASIPYSSEIHEASLKRMPIIESNKRKKYYEEYSELAKFLILSANPSSELKLDKNSEKTTPKRNREFILKNKA